MKAIARCYGLRQTSLRAFLVKHFPAAVKARREAGAAVIEARKNIAKEHSEQVLQRKAAYKASKVAKYAKAVELFAKGDRSAQSIANELELSKSAFCSYLRAHHQDLIENRRRVRASLQRAEL